MSGHAELIARLEVAAGPDREIDTDLWWVLSHTAALRCFNNGALGLPRDLPATLPIPAGLGRAGVRAMAPAYTASVGAALALVERVLPGMLVENLGEMRDAGELTGHWLAQLGPRGPRRRMTGAITAANLRATLDAEEPVSAVTPALALCIATLRALEAA